MDDFKNAFSLNGKTALVIGAGGLSLPIARALMQNGADIILADMKEPDGAFAASCYAEGRQCTFVQVNLLDEESIVKMVAAARNVTGRIDILVNAAGVQTAAPSCMCWAFMWMAAWRSILRIRPICSSRCRRICRGISFRWQSR